MDKNKDWNLFYFESHKAELEQILNQGFSIPNPFAKIAPSELKSILLIPSFLIQYDDFKKLHGSKKERNHIAGKYQSLTPRELIYKKETSRDQLELIHESLSEIFKAVSEVIKDELRQDLKRIIDNSIASPGKKVELIENLCHKADDLKSFFGIEYASRRVKSGGLIFGTNVDDCLLSIQQYGSIETTLEGSRIPQDDELSNIQTEVSLNKLRQYQELALPYAEQFLGVQIALRYKDLETLGDNAAVTDIRESHQSKGHESVDSGKRETIYKEFAELYCSHGNVKREVNEIKVYAECWDQYGRIKGPHETHDRAIAKKRAIGVLPSIEGASNSSLKTIEDAWIKYKKENPALFS